MRRVRRFPVGSLQAQGGQIDLGIVEGEHQARIRELRIRDASGAAATVAFDAAQFEALKLLILRGDAATPDAAEAAGPVDVPKPVLQLVDVKGTDGQRAV